MSLFCSFLSVFGYMCVSIGDAGTSRGVVGKFSGSNYKDRRKKALANKSDEIQMNLELSSTFLQNVSHFHLSFWLLLVVCAIIELPEAKTETKWKRGKNSQDESMIRRGWIDEIELSCVLARSFKWCWNFYVFIFIRRTRSVVSVVLNSLQFSQRIAQQNIHAKTI